MSGLSEVDIRDWSSKCQKAKMNADDSRYGPDMTSYTSHVELLDFLDEIQNYFKSQQKQVAALFQPPKK